MYKGKKLIVITGGFNEEGKISRVINRIPEFVDFVFAVDDGSRDNTFKELITAKTDMAVRNKRNKGAGNVLKQGLKFAIEKRFDIVIIIAGDNQDDPSEIRRLIEPIVSERYDFTLGSRFLKKEEIKKIPLARRIALIMYNVAFNLRIKRHVKVTDASNGFRAFKTICLKKVRMDRRYERYEFEPYMLLELIKKGCKFKEVFVTKSYDKKKGFSKMKPLIDWFRIIRPLFVLK